MSWTLLSIDNALTNQIAENNMTTKENYVMCQKSHSKGNDTIFWSQTIVDFNFSAKFFVNSPKMSTASSDVLAYYQSQ